jgi:hypothetical protein
MKFKMAATAGLSFFSETTWTVETKLQRTNWFYVKTISCSGSHLGIPINIKNTKFVKDLLMIDFQLVPP